MNGRPAPLSLARRKRSREERSEEPAYVSAYEPERKAVAMRRRRARSLGTKNLVEEDAPPSDSAKPTWVGRLLLAGATLLKPIFGSEPTPSTQHTSPIASSPAPPSPGVSAPADPYPHACLSGMAFAGGGIRSATFCLGVLQALGERDCLKMFDFLSTVSGGGYIGGWYSAWISRDRRIGSEQGLFPQDELLEPDRYRPELLGAAPPAPGVMQSRPSPAGPADGSASASLEDPIHHVRLFSNYLTPRKGILSADTWRAITFVARNIVLTWMVLLPILLAAVLVGQLYFVANDATRAAFICPRSQPVPVTASQWAAHDSLVNGLAACSPARLARSEVLGRRVGLIVQPAVIALVWGSVLVFLWVLFSVGTWLRASIGILGVGGMLLLILIPGTVADWWTAVRRPGFHLPALSATTWLAAGGALVLLLWCGVVEPIRQYVMVNWPTFVARVRGRAAPGLAWRGVPYESLRVMLIERNTIVVALWAALTVVLLLAAFGHEIFWAFNTTVQGQVAKAGGLLAFLLAVGSGVYTAFKNAPASDGVVTPPSKMNTIIFALAPPLVVVALAILLAAFGQFLIANYGDHHGAKAAAIALMVGIGLEAFYAITESKTAASAQPYPPWTPAAAGVVVAGLIWIVRGGLSQAVLPASFALWYTVSVAALAAFRMMTTKGEDGDVFALTVRAPRVGHAAPAAAPANASVRPVNEVADVNAGRAAFAAADVNAGRAAFAAGSGRLGAWVILGLLAIGAIVASMLGHVWQAHASPVEPLWQGRANFAVYASTFVLVLVLVDLVGGRGDAKRVTSLGLVVACGAIAIVVAAIASRTAPQVGFVICLIGVSVAITIGLGWTIDPNLLALHGFYKGRLIRAYLGASNFLYRWNQEITQGAPGDDIAMSDLKNAERGAPIHLINTTLNLVGGRDLATAQRSAAPFIMSAAICGSMRTGYRTTKEYMANRLTLGAAVATSGAAVSPNMGSKTQSAAIALLLGLFNVRLGMWAPTPYRDRWREPRTIMWPFYLLRESLSQTNDLGSFCYLTDGGHFDNTGVYSLVERACRYILFVDSGQDPQPCFADLGDAIRRCRIDFGAEIDLSAGASQFVKFGGSKPKGTEHWVVGTVRYSEPHLKLLQWPQKDIDDPNKRTGIIVWVKPGVTDEDSVDVRQYRLEHGSFPNDTTVNQWFSEATFESYRALGYQSIAGVLDQLCETHRELLTPDCAGITGLFDYLASYVHTPMAHSRSARTASTVAARRAGR